MIVDISTDKRLFRYRLKDKIMLFPEYLRTLEKALKCHANESGNLDYFVTQRLLKLFAAVTVALGEGL